MLDNHIAVTRLAYTNCLHRLTTQFLCGLAEPTVGPDLLVEPLAVGVD